MGEKMTTVTRQEIINAYKSMEKLPGQLYDCVQNYSERVKKENARHNQVLSDIQRDFNTKKTALDRKKQVDYGTADNARQTVVKQLQEMRAQLNAANNAYNNAINSLPQFPKLGKAAVGGVLGEALQRIVNRHNVDLQGFENTYNQLLSQENRIYSEKISEIDKAHGVQLSAATDNYTSRMERENQNTKKIQEEILEEMEQNILNLQPDRVRELYEMLQTNIPRVMNYEAAKQMPSAVEIGYIDVDIDQWRREGDIVVELIRDNFSFALKTTNGKTSLQLPYGRAFDDPNFNKLIRYDRNRRQDALDYMRALEMRLFMSIPCGKLRVTMVDPVDLGSNFSMFSCLGDDDERIISTKIWSDSKRIKEQLNLLIGQIEHVNQDCLRNEYENIVVYNEHVGKNAEPLQILFVADFPKQFDKESCELLEKVISSGPKCGIYTIIAGETDEIANNMDIIGRILQTMEIMDYRTDCLSYQYMNRTNAVIPVAMPAKADHAGIFSVLMNGIKTSDRIVINFDEISDELTRHPELWFQFSDKNGLDVPIGLEGAARTVQVHLGGEFITQHHALISGTIGSGKSTLLHTMIMSILLRYSPEDAQIYLLDFKRGVEFKVYAESGLPNFRVISLETEPEFGLAVLEHLEQEQEYRAQVFHEHGCDNIERYNEIAETDMSDSVYKLPRIVAIIDEFHEMFANPDSQISKDCARLLEQIVRQGRAMGIHVVLASQTLPDNVAVIYGQIMNRIALQSTAASAQHILDSNNEAVNTLVNVDSGKGIFNDGGGNRDANHPFRVAYFKEDEQKELLIRIKERQQEVLGEFDNEKPRLLLSSIQDDIDNPLNRFVKEGVIPQHREFGCPLYLGEEIAMVNDFSIRLTARRAQNLLILGAEQKRANQLYSFAAMSILFNCIRQSPDGRLPDEPVITYFDFAENRSMAGHRVKRGFDIMNELSARFPSAIRVFGRNSLMDGIEMLQEEVEHDNQQRRHYVIFAGLNRAKRLLDNDSAYAMSPRQTFMNLVKNGPAAGMNFIVWANEPSSFCSFYNELLSEFDYRLVYNLKEDEYEQVVKSSEMDTSYGNNVIAYNPDDENKKVRIYSMPLLGWFEKFMDRLDGGEDMGEFDGEF